MFPAQSDRLQPTLFDRLSDDAPFSPLDREDKRTLSRTALRKSVLESLGALFNATQPSRLDPNSYPHVANSVLGYGLPALAGRLASKIDVSTIENLMLTAIRRYEPRIIGATLSVHAVQSRTALAMHNVIQFEIRGQLRHQPVPIEILLRTQIDLEGGHISVTDLG